MCVRKPREVAGTVNVRGLGVAVEAGRRWALDERGIRTSCEIYGCSPSNAGGGREGCRTTVGASDTTAESATLARIGSTIVERTKAHVRGDTR